MSPRKLVWLTPLLGMMALSCGCDQRGNGTASNGKPRIALIMKARTNPFFARMEEGARLAAEESGADLRVWDLEKETDSAKQAAHVETAISQEVKVILIAPADSKAIVAPLMQAQRQGIRIINIDNRIDPSEARRAGLNVAAFIGPDNVKGAKKSAEAMIQAMGGEGEVAMLEGIRGVDNAESRKRGFEQAVQGTGGKIKVVAMDTALWDREMALSKTEAFINAYPNLKGIFCANDQMALGVLAALTTAGKNGKVVVAAYDNLEEIRDPIRNGNVHATIEQHPDKMGALGVEYGVELIRGEGIPAEIEVPTDLITRENLP